MIAKLKKGSGFGGLVNYANDVRNKQTNIIASEGVSLTNNKSITASFKMQAKSNMNVKKFVGHISLSFSPDDVARMSDSLVREIAMQYLHRMGIRNTQYVIFRHHDQPHDHVHIIYNRVDNDCNEIKCDSNFKKSIAITQILTREYNLTFGKDKKKVRRERLRGKDAAKYRIHDILQAALEKCQTWKELETVLNKEGISFRVAYRSDGLAKGISFTDGKYSFAGGKLDRSLTYWKINSVFVSNRERVASTSAAGPLSGVMQQQVQRGSSSIDVGNNSAAQAGANSVGGNVTESAVASLAESVMGSAESVAEGVNSVASGAVDGIVDIVLQPDVVPVVSSGGGGGSSKDDDDEDKDKYKDKRRPQKVTYTPTKKYRSR